jgi:signal transduction histidine kinase
LLPRSLRARLILAALAWSLPLLILTGWGLSALYRQSVVAQLDRDLAVTADSLLAELEADDAGAITLAEAPNDGRFQRTLSGRYWEIVRLGPGGAEASLFRSRSLWDASLAGDARRLAALGAREPGQPEFWDQAGGPDGEPLRMYGRTVRPPGAAAKVGLLVAADPRPVLEGAAQFSATLYAALVLLALGLAAAVALQVGVALRPLDGVRTDIAAVRRGRAARLEGPYPQEIEPLTVELNALLEHNREIVERARTQVGNLAHALKTPIAVMLNEARDGETSALPSLVERQTLSMTRSVDAYLARARAAAMAEGLGARAEVRPVLDDITRMLQRLHARDGVEIRLNWEPGPEPVFRGERQDLEDMVGNLIENACKYGGGEVHVAVGARDGLVRVRVEDDGPGLSPDARVAALKRGVRLDEQSRPGHGLGLAMVVDLARLYKGDLELGESLLGGLEAVLTLPATD